MSTRTVGKSPVGAPSDYYVREILPCAERVASITYGSSGVGNVTYVPIQIIHPVTVDAVIIYNGGVAGNVTVGVYDSVGGLPNALLATSLSTLVAGANSRQAVMLTALLSLTPGLYFAARESSNVGHTILEHYLQARLNAGDGISFYEEELGAYLALPALATPVQSASREYCHHLVLRVASIP